MKSIPGIFVLIAMSITAAAAHAEVRPYLGVGLGFNEFSTNFNATSGASLDESDSGYRLSAGVRFNDYLAAEIFHADLGSITLSGNTGSGFSLNGASYVFLAPGTLVQEVTTTGYGVIVSLPFAGDGQSRLRPFIRFGLHSWDSDQTANFSGVNATWNDDGSNGFIGGGIEFDFSRHVGARLAYDWYKVKDDDGVIDHISTLGLDILLRF